MGIEQENDMECNLRNLLASATLLAEHCSRSSRTTMMTVSTLCRPEVRRDLNTGERMFRQDDEDADEDDICDVVDIDAALEQT